MPKLAHYLKEAKYDREKSKKLIDGFTLGFSLGYKGKEVKIKQTAPNLKLRVGSLMEMWNKIMKEVKDECFAGPYPIESPPFEAFIQSPIGLVPKDQGKKTRVIFHLSYPRNSGLSVNANIPKEDCSVHYNDFDLAVKRCLEEVVGCHISKSDMSMAFRNLPMSKKSWIYLVIRAQHPVTLKWYFFVDKCLPFGASISCKLFQEFSDAIAFVVKPKTHKVTVNYLDDFLFAAFLKQMCDQQVQIFLDICKDI